MPRVLFLTVHRPDRSPSQRFRFEQYLQFLQDNGWEYDFSWILDANADKVFYKSGGFLAKASIVVKGAFQRLGELLNGKSYDIVFVQREAIMLGTAWFEKMFARYKGKLVFDFDDSIWLLDVSEGNKKFAWLKNPAKTGRIISVSDHVVAGNQYLADYALQFNSRVSIVPTTIDTAEYDPGLRTDNGDKVCIGWSGSQTTIKHFEYAQSALLKIAEEFGDRVTFKVVGDGDYRNSDLGIRGKAWSKKDEVSDLGSMDIGIMPLPDDQWANGKCGLKGLQYMAMEVATIMSPVGVNSEIIQHGSNGLLASSDDEWVESLRALVSDQQLRKILGKKGRQTVVDSFSVESQKSRYLDLFNSLL